MVRWLSKVSQRCPKTPHRRGRSHARVQAALLLVAYAVTSSLVTGVAAFAQEEWQCERQPHAHCSSQAMRLVSRRHVPPFGEEQVARRYPSGHPLWRCCAILGCRWRQPLHLAADRGVMTQRFESDDPSRSGQPEPARRRPESPAQRVPSSWRTGSVVRRMIMVATGELHHYASQRVV